MPLILAVSEKIVWRVERRGGVWRVDGVITLPLVFLELQSRSFGSPLSWDKQIEGVVAIHLQERGAKVEFEVECYDCVIRVRLGVG